MRLSAGIRAVLGGLVFAVTAVSLSTKIIPAADLAKQQTWIEGKQTQEERWGYFITTLYQQRGLYWYRADGMHGAITLPIFERLVISLGARPKQVPKPPIPVSDESNDPAIGIHGKIAGMDEKAIHIEPGLGCQIDSARVIVEDTKNGREIEVGLFTNRESILLPEIVRAHLAVAITGVQRWPDADVCGASAIWANRD